MKKKKIFTVSFEMVDYGSKDGNFYNQSILKKYLQNGIITIRRIKDKQLVGAELKKFKVIEMK